MTLAGQEINDESYAICKSDMIAKGQAVGAIQQGDTLNNDKHAGQAFDYCLSNPPYGVDWRASEPVVRAEHEAKHGRFDAGLPRISDGQMLFLQHLVAKMRPARKGDPHSGGRAAIVLNGSPLFTGGAGSGESEIRRHLIEGDLVDAIIALPTNMFFNTGIATYVWVLDNDKPPARTGKIQLIDGSGFWTKLRKNLGAKNRELGDADREAIVALYRGFEEGEHCKIVEPDDLGFWEITVERPLRLRFDVDPQRLDEYLGAKAVAKLPQADRDALRAALAVLAGREFADRPAFVKVLNAAAKAHGVTPGAPVVKALWRAVGERDDDAPACLDAKGNPEPDAGLRDTELVPFRDDVDAYFTREVLPYVQDAWIDESKTKVGYEIPFTRMFHRYVPPRPLEEIDAELNQLAREIIDLLEAVEG